ALLGFDVAMRVRNAVWRPPFVMYYRTWPLRAVHRDLTAAGFAVTTRSLTSRAEEGTPQDGTPQAGNPQAGTPQAGTPQAGPPQGGLFLARKASAPG
ncbi:MAG: hypothetical protein ACRDNO_07165, partial [Trebonia sp.]